MKRAHESFHTAPITRCSLSWRGWIWRALDTALDLSLLALAGIMIGYALGNLIF
jgi:hypothetical protein